MRKIFIDLSSDNYLQQPKMFGGYEGEHNETYLQVKLPKRMIGIECSGYRFDFQTSEGNEISSPLIQLSEDDTLSFRLVKQLTVAGKLIFKAVAVLADETTVHLISKTNTVILCIENSPKGNIQLIDPSGYKDELLKMIDERILEINPAKVDQTYNPESINAQSGKAVVEAIEKNRGNTIYAPKLYEDISKYTNPLTGLSVVSDVIIETGSYIKKIKFYSNGSGYCLIFLIRASDNVCIYRKYIEDITQGWNEFTIGFKTEEDCYLGLYNTMVMYTNSGVTDEYKYSFKVKSCTPLSPNINDVVTISNLYSGNFALAVEWEISKGLQTDFDKKIDTNQGVENKGKILSVDDSGNVVCENKNKIYPHGGIISFIDDDCGQYAPEIWGDIISQTGIRMGFACVTDIMEKGAHTTEVYKPMQLTELRALYNDGHEVYSHSHTHPDFHSNSTTLEDIDLQCCKSRDWLNANGFVRNSDIIVYPGGMGNDMEKQAVVRQHYRYGIDTIGGGINPEPIKNPWCVYRYDADTGTLDELKAVVDTAIAENKLLVFMNHAYELNKDKTNQIQKMVDLINYIKQQNGTILPFQEAIHRIYGW